MTDTTSLLRLMSWLSPVFPTGGFAYSAGLEQAVAGAGVSDVVSLQTWVATQIENGNLWNDAVFFAEAYRNAGDAEKLTELTRHAIAMTNAYERLDEAILQGTSFIQAARPWVDLEQLSSRGTPLPICVGCAAGSELIDLNSALSAYLHAFVTNQLQAAIRLSAIGQSGAARLLSALEPVIANAARLAANSTLEDLGTCAFFADIEAMKHETLQPRLFRS
ncbi:MAG: urease accessory protein UreF [Pseudomonadota bacterium]